MGVVVVFDAYSRLGNLLPEGVGLARADQTRLEVIAVVSPFRSLFIGHGLAYSGMPREKHEQDLRWELDEHVSLVPDDIPVRSRILNGGRRLVRREVAALSPIAVLGARRYQLTSDALEVLFVDSDGKSTSMLNSAG